MTDKIQELQTIIDTYDNIVFFGGAGVSTEIAPKTHTNIIPKKG